MTSRIADTDVSDDLLASPPPGDDLLDMTALQPTPARPDQYEATLAPGAGTTGHVMDTRTHIGPLTWPTMSVKETARLLGISPEAGYDAVRRGDLPSLRIGRKILIPTAKLAAMLGIDHGGGADQ
jgi:excisionase family DNA binding protein